MKGSKCKGSFRGLEMKEGEKKPFKKIARARSFKASIISDVDSQPFIPDPCGKERRVIPGWI